jgi:biopolymer transport protein ExbD
MRFGTFGLVSAAVCVLIACTPKHSIRSASLEIHENGEFTLDGKTVSAAELRNALVALTKPGIKVCVTVTASKTTPYAKISTLMQDVEKAGISCVAAAGVDS